MLRVVDANFWLSLLLLLLLLLQPPFGTFRQFLIILGNPKHRFLGLFVCRTVGNGARFLGALAPMLRVVDGDFSHSSEGSALKRSPRLIKAKSQGSFKPRAAALSRTVCAHGTRAVVAQQIESGKPCSLLGRRRGRQRRRLSMRSRSTVGYNPGSVLMNRLIGKDNPLRW